MNKLTQLLLFCYLACLPLATWADGNKDPKDDARYLAGAVPEVDGKVVFSKKFKIPGMTQEQIYNRILEWMDGRLKENKNIDSRVVYKDEKTGTIAGIGEEWLVFRSSALSLDRSLLNYQITVTCKPQECLVELEKIRFTYRETEKYTAEEWITDKYALNKTKTKLVRGLAKWRRKTVDFADDMFNDVAIALGAPTAKPKPVAVEKKKPSIAATPGPVVIQTTPAQPAAVATPDKTSEPSGEGRLVDLKQIPGEVFSMMGNSTIVVIIGKDAFNRTTMTANAGGALGYQSGKAVAYCTLSPDQPYEALEKADTYTLQLIAANQTTPSAVIECKKIQSQTPQVAGQPRTYVGEIVKLWIK